MKSTRSKPNKIDKLEDNSYTKQEDYKGGVANCSMAEKSKRKPY